MSATIMDRALKVWWRPVLSSSLQWRHNELDSVSNHQPHGCLLNRLFRRRSKKTSKPRVTGLCVGNSPRPVNSPHKGPVTRKMFPFDDVIMIARYWERIAKEWATSHKHYPTRLCPSRLRSDKASNILLMECSNAFHLTTVLHFYKVEVCN